MSKSLLRIIKAVFSSPWFPASENTEIIKIYKERNKQCYIRCYSCTRLKKTQTRAVKPALRELRSYFYNI